MSTAFAAIAGIFPGYSLILMGVESLPAALLATSLYFSIISIIERKKP